MHSLQRGAPSTGGPGVNTPDHSADTAKLAEAAASAERLVREIVAADPFYAKPDVTKKAQFAVACIVATCLKLVQPALDMPSACRIINACCPGLRQAKPLNDNTLRRVTSEMLDYHHDSCGLPADGVQLTWTGLKDAALGNASSVRGAVCGYAAGLGVDKVGPHLIAALSGIATVPPETPGDTHRKKRKAANNRKRRRNATARATADENGEESCQESGEEYVKPCVAKRLKMEPADEVEEAGALQGQWARPPSFRRSASGASASPADAHDAFSGLDYGQSQEDLVHELLVKDEPSDDLLLSPLASNVGCPSLCNDNFAFPDFLKNDEWLY